MFQVFSLWLSSIISCVSKNLSHFLLVIHFAVTQLLTVFSLLLLWQKLSLPVLAVTIFSPTLHDAERFVYVSGIYRSKTWFPWALFCFLSCFSSVVFTSFLHLTLGLLCSYFFRVLKCQLRLWDISSFPVAIDFILSALFVTICCKTFFYILLFLFCLFKRGSSCRPAHQCQDFTLSYILFLIYSMYFNHSSCIIFYSC